MKTIFTSCLLLFNILRGMSQWTEIAAGAGDIYCITFIDDMHGFLCGGSTYITSDGGDTWSFSGGSDVQMEISFYDASYGYTTTVVGMNPQRTINGGDTWTDYIRPTGSSTWDVWATSQTTFFIGATDGEVYRSTNAGSSFSLVAASSLEPVEDIIFTDANTGFIVYQDGLIRKTTDGGSYWTTSYTYDGFITCMDFPDDETGYVSASNGTVLKTTNGGDSWTELSTGSEVYLTAIDFYDAMHGIVAGISGTIFMTSDGGATWQDISYGSSSFKEVVYKNEHEAFVGGDDGLLIKRSDLGTAVTAPEVAEPWIHCAVNNDGKTCTVMVHANAVAETMFELYTVSGALAQRVMLSSEKTIVNTAACNAGIYFYKARQANGSCASGNLYIE